MFPTFVSWSFLGATFIPTLPKVGVLYLCYIIWLSHLPAHHIVIHGVSNEYTNVHDRSIDAYRLVPGVYSYFRSCKLVGVHPAAAGPV